VTRVTIQKLEAGVREPRPSTMARIAAALGVQIRAVDEFAAPPPPGRGRPQRPQDGP
jgi:transcriptional regulator with XRE-family HTH domain